MAKRVLDLLLGTILALVALPVILFLALLVAVSIRAWPLFVHERVGKGGRSFRCPKLRTLPRGTPAYAMKIDIPVVAQGRVARFLRRTHLDELPQLLLVPFGKMSLVGPRPKMPDGYEPVDPTYAMVRGQVTQGCTGLWQISRHKSGMPHQSPDYDYFYVQHQSIALDLWILWRTALGMAGIGRPIELRDVPAVLVRMGTARSGRYLRPQSDHLIWNAAAWDTAVS